MPFTCRETTLTYAKALEIARGWSQLIRTPNHSKRRTRSMLLDHTHKNPTNRKAAIVVDAQITMLQTVNLKRPNATAGARLETLLLPVALSLFSLESLNQPLLVCNLKAKRLTIYKMTHNCLTKMPIAVMMNLDFTE